METAKTFTCFFMSKNVFYSIFLIFPPEAPFGHVQLYQFIHFSVHKVQGNRGSYPSSALFYAYFVLLQNNDTIETAAYPVFKFYLVKYPVPLHLPKGLLPFTYTFATSLHHPKVHRDNKHIRVPSVFLLYILYSALVIVLVFLWLHNIQKGIAPRGCD